MRVLVLLRKSRGGGAAIAHGLPPLMARHGIEVVVDDASWIANETGWSVDREVSKRLAADQRGFDLVHAFEYRSAWACGSAFGLRLPWVYTAYGVPKTTHSELVEKLCAARRGLCVSRAVFDALDAVDTVNLEVVVPAAPEYPMPPSREAGRSALGVGQGPLVLAMGEMRADRGFDALEPAMRSVWSEHAEASLVVIGEGPAHPSFVDRRATLLPSWVERPEDWLIAADVVVVPSRNAGFSRLAVEAMALGLPVVLRRSGGLAEIGVPDLSVYDFDEDDQLGASIGTALASPLRSASVAEAGKVWVQDRLSPDRFANQLKRIYEEALGLG